MHIKKLCSTIVLFLTAALPLSGLDVTGGNLKLVLFEDSGRFNIYYRTDAAKNEYTPLLSDRDPASSLLSVVINNSVQTVEPGTTFRQQVLETPLGARFVWTSPLVTITQDFAFISEGGVKISLSIKNVSESALVAGAAYLFDTWLGEGGKSHFSTDRDASLEQEAVSSGSTLAAAWISRDFGAKENPKTGLRVIAIDQGVTKPDKIVFANWKRLYDNLWDYRKAEEKDFSARPYSFADSAVAQYYEPANIAKNATREITLVLGNFASALTTRELGGSATTAENGDQPVIINESYRRTVERVNILNNLLEEIDRKIKAGEDFDPEDMEKVKTLLVEIKKSPETQITDIQARVKILNNLLAELDAMIKSGAYSAEDIAKMDALIKLMEEEE